VGAIGASEKKKKKAKSYTEKSDEMDVYRTICFYYTRWIRRDSRCMEIDVD